jgi:putative ABC transport system permease protein
MFTNYLKIAFRQIRLFKTYSFINIVGLSIGLASSFIILLYILYQISFDRYNEQLDNIYLVTSEKKVVSWTQPLTPLIFAPTLKSEFPEVKEFARWDARSSTMKYKDKTFEETRCVYSDPEIFKILTLPFKYGDLNSLIQVRDFLVLSETMAKKYFGERNPIGEIISVECGKEKYDLKIVAVMKDIPKTSTFSADFIGPLYIVEKRFAEYFIGLKVNPALDWNMDFSETYLLLSSETDVKNFEQKLVDFSSRHLHPPEQTIYRLMPLKDIYFHSSFMVNSRFPSGNISNVYIYSAAAFLILFIACVNYLMLNLGRASLRTKEVGVRKVIGAFRFDLFNQIITEAIVVSLLSLPIAVVLVQLLLPDLSQLLGVKIAGDYFHNWGYVLIFCVITVVIGIITGSYISFYLSSFNPIDILKNKLSSGSKKVLFRRILISSQMIIFVGLIFSSLIIYKQLRYFINKDFGFNKEQLVVLYPDERDFGNRFDAFKNELKSNPDILNISGANILPGSGDKGVSLFPKKDNPGQMVPVEGISVDKDFIEAMEMKMVLGTSFQNSVSSDSESDDKISADCIINESTVRELGIKNPIGELVGNKKVIGVVRDFNMHSLHEKINPLMITMGRKYMSEVVIRLTPGNIPNTVKFIQEKSKQFNKGKLMEIEFFDDRISGQYIEEQKFSKVIGYATGLSIFVACLGIFGISLFITQQRVKEIGIRKVLGASIKDVFQMVTKEFFVLVLISSIIAFPIGYYFMNDWLRNFEYRINIDVWVFLLSALIGITVVFITVSYRAIKAALANPVKSLKYE